MLVVMIRTAAILMVAAGALGAHDLMPAPVTYRPVGGRLRIDENFRVEFTGYREPRLEAAAVRLREVLSRSSGIPMPGASQAPAALTVHCERAGDDESYHLTITPQQAKLDAVNPLGVLRGLQTFRQMANFDRTGFGAPAADIEDHPRFAWRGFMLDAARHWMPLEAVERTLDGMAAVKLNVFHWHLSDDQGFRVESRRFPKLQALGSDGNFYTQDQVREVVAYAHARGIRVVPEFDMPGHTTSWFVGYPELASAPGPYQIQRGWGVFDPAMDPTREETYQFLDRFIGEMTRLFPDEYFHIGGDEVNGKQWDANPRIQEFKRAHGMQDNAALQAYFTRRVQAIVQKHGKRMIGWDEILNPDLPRDIIVQSWRGQQSLAEAARQGVSGILSHGYYLDLMHSAGQHYAVDPLGDGAADLTAEQKQRILGGEACMWSEFVTPELLDGRVWPRLAAIAERLWSPADVTDEKDMYRRLAIVSRELEWLGLTHVSNYHRMLERLAGAAPVGPVETLAEVVEPVKGYSREGARHYDSFTPLNRLVDAARPSSEAAREFELQVEVFVDIPWMRERLQAWRTNNARLRPIMIGSALLQEDAEISVALWAVAGIGLQALDFIEAGKAAPADWVKQATAMLDKAAAPQGELLLSVVGPVRKLVDKARGS
jgi:hexosaminidase